MLRKEVEEDLVARKTNKDSKDNDDESRAKFKKKWDEIFSHIKIEKEMTVSLELISRIDIRLDNGKSIYINPREIVENEDISFDDLEKIIYNKIMDLQDSTSHVEYHMDIERITEIVEEKANDILKGI